MVTLTPLSDINAIGFYLTDPNDARGRFSIGGVDFLLADIFGSWLANGTVFYISLFDSAGLGAISLYSNTRADGYGIDNVTIGNLLTATANVAVPEPGVLTLLGLGLLGLGVMRTRRAPRRL
jgi:hypothetical protein